MNKLATFRWTKTNLVQVLVLELALGRQMGRVLDCEYKETTIHTISLIAWYLCSWVSVGVHLVQISFSKTEAQKTHSNSQNMRKTV